MIYYRIIMGHIFVKDILLTKDIYVQISLEMTRNIDVSRRQEQRKVKNNTDLTLKKAD